MALSAWLLASDWTTEVSEFESRWGKNFHLSTSFGPVLKSTILLYRYGRVFSSKAAVA
jgi:hypothetical protein